MNHDSESTQKNTPPNEAHSAAPAEANTHQQSPPISPTPPKGPRVLILFVVGVAIVIAFTAGGFLGPAALKQTRRAFQTVSSTQSDQDSDLQDEQGEIGSEYFTCGMHPWVVLPEPGECPICHMDLIPIDPEKFTGEININPVVSQNIGVRVAPVEFGPVIRTIRTIGTVTYDETSVRDVNIKAPGWIEKLYVDYEGVQVHKGDPLFEHYSPKLYSAQSEYISALRLRGQVGTDFLPDTQLDAERLIADARAQLEYFDITDEQIEALEASGVPSKTMLMRSPHTGVVIAKHANEGMRVDQGMRVFQIADLSKVWVMVTLYEYQLPFVKVGQHATMHLPYIPGESFEGRVLYIYPYLDEKTRQVQVRMEFENADQILKPGMFASIDLQNTLPTDRIIVPRSAVIDTGERQVAIVSLGKGSFEPRDVRMGVETDNGMVEIIEGLNPGEMVVTSGQFLLDSESRIRESLAKMIRGDLAVEQKPVVEVAAQSQLASLPPAMSTELRTLLEQYLTISELLASDSTQGINTLARTLASSAESLTQTTVPDNQHFWHQHTEINDVREKALELADAPDKETARPIFADLSTPLIELLKATGIPPGLDIQVQQLHCPMYRKDQDGSWWLQKAGDVRNPYMGSAMIECFDERSTVPVTGPQADQLNTLNPSQTSAQTDSTAQPPAASPAESTPLDTDALVQAYLTLQDTLTRDDLGKTTAALHSVQSALEKLPHETNTPQLAEKLDSVRAASTISAQDLSSFRKSFQPLSDAMIDLVSVAPPSSNVAPNLYRAYCPMEKASWLQLGETIRNPYLPSMPECGSIKETYPLADTRGGAR